MVMSNFVGHLICITPRTPELRSCWGEVLVEVEKRAKKTDWLGKQP